MLQKLKAQSPPHKASSSRRNQKENKPNRPGQRHLRNAAAPEYPRRARTLAGILPLEHALLSQLVERRAVELGAEGGVNDELFEDPLALGRVGP